MRDPKSIPQRIAIAWNPDVPDADREAREMESALRAAGLSEVHAASLQDAALHASVGAGAVDLLVALGGDGTMLRAGRLCGPNHVPVLGINMGRFGFLMEVERGQWRDFLSPLLAGHFRLEDRMMLQAEHWRGDTCLNAWTVMNEVVVCRGKDVRPIRLRACVDGYQLATYVADGLIAATPTGSSAYALAAGGPIMPPELRNILIIPVAPHLSVDRAVILSEGVCVTIHVESRYDTVVSVDGQNPEQVLEGDLIKAYAGDHGVSFVRFQDAGYFYRNLTAYMEQNPTSGLPLR
ncbi:NAD(+)/NADH kinase [Ornatilinea apprima]|uniref:NAD(+)/NADH kinase n=1 Tax=Ornatilinea apprima TaxID=1134406 RepID=UPI0009467575|nr:NAD(+)/NADH kinase [Ornatilinea apprima]